MYAKNNNYVTYFVEEEAKNTDKVFYGRVSEAIKVGEENGKNKYEFESWNARNPYSKEHKRNYPYLLIMDFEIPEQK